MRVLLLADDCNPEWPSLPVVGYKAARAIGRTVDLVLATHVRNRPNIEKHGFPEGEVRYLDNEYLAAPMHRLSTLLRGGEQVNWTTAIAMGYPSMVAFEHEAWSEFGYDLVQGRFDVVHRLTPMSPTLPSPLATKSPVPFVLGPLNGALPWPSEFMREFRREREHLRVLRKAYKWLPYIGSTYRNAAAILASFDHTIADLPASARSRIIDFPEVGLDPDLFQFVPRDVSGPLTFIFVGRFVALKLLDVAIRTFAGSDVLRQHRLVLVGDGVERAPLEALIEKHRLSDVVEITGWLDQAEVGARVRDADVFFFPSIRELGAGVVVEAMACGTVPVVVDYGGPGGLVIPGAGTKVPLGDKDHLVAAFTKVLEGYVADRDLLRRHQDGARKQSEHFTWDRKAQKTLEIYDWVLGRRRIKPRFGGALGRRT
ncbi:MAG: glycosyltransferase [Myxococcota bacterium]